MLLRGLAKLVAVVVVAGGVGIALGIGFAKLFDAGDLPTPAGNTGTTVDGSTAGVARSTTPDRSSQPDARDPLGQVRVRVLDDAVLRLAETRSGRQRQRARLTVRIRAANGAWPLRGQRCSSETRDC